jgi:hypothetical protein
MLDFTVYRPVQGMEHGKVLPGILAELGIAVDIQHTDIEVGNRQGPLEVPRVGEVFVRDHQLHPEFPVGLGADDGKKAPVELFDKLKGPHHHRMGPLIPDNRFGKLHELGKSADFLGDDPVIQEGKKLIVGNRL